MTRRTFDFVLLMLLLFGPAKGLVHLAAQRWSQNETGALKTLGDAVVVAS